MKQTPAVLVILLLIVGVVAPSLGRGADDETSAIQLIALEAARQAMLEAQLTEIVTGVDELLADIATNAEVSEAATTSASDLRGRLDAIVQMRLVPARELLNQAMKDQQKVAAAQQYIELAARDLASLLLQAGAGQASEVFAIELREIITMQEKLQLAAGSTSAVSGNQSPVTQQIDLAERVAALTSELAALDQVPRNPLAAVRLARAREIIEQGEVVASMRQAGEAWTMSPLDVAALQAQALRHLRQGVLKLRPDASLEELVRARNVVQEITDSQRALRTAIAALTATALEGQKEGLQLEQQRMLIPLQEFGEVIGIDLPQQIAEQAGSDAAEALQSGDTDAALAAQVRVEDAMVLARVQINKQIDRLNSLSQTRRQMLDAATRMKSLTELRDRVESIRNTSYEVATAQQDLASVATAQQQLAQDITRFQSQLPEDDLFASAISRPLGKAAQACKAAAESAQRDGRTVLDLTDQQSLLTLATQQVQENVEMIREALPMDASVGLAIESMTKAEEALGQDQPEPALESIDQAIASLKAADETKTRLVEQFELIPMELDAALELSGRAKKILEAQIDLREETEDASEEEFDRLAGDQDVIHAETKVIGSLAFVPQVKSSFRLALDEMAGAIEELKIPARGPAVEHQQRAEVALQEGVETLDTFISGLILAAENSDDDPMVIAFLDGIHALVLLAAAQKELNELTLETPESMLPFHVEKETAFRDRAKEISQRPNLLTLEGRIAGWEHIEAAAEAMEQAVVTLENRAKDPTITQQQKAERELRIAIGMNVFELTMALKPPEEPGVVPSDNPEFNSPDIWMNFSKGRVSGDLPSGKQGEWDSLVDRERSALHENFARELPLEYRQLLKDYYRSLAK